MTAIVTMVPVGGVREEDAPLLLGPNAFKSSADECTIGGVDMIGRLQCNPGRAPPHQRDRTLL